MQRINEKDLKWEVPSNEDPKDPGTWKRVIVKHDEVDPKSKLMMVNLARILVGRIHPAHRHRTMEEIFYFQEGEGEVVLDGKSMGVVAGDRIIVPAGVKHEIRNTGKIELKFIGFGIALD